MPRAPRKCPGRNGECETRIRPPAKYCERCTQEQAWQGPRTDSSTMNSRPGWAKLRLTILERDHHRCRIQTPGRCTIRATHVDHIIPVAHGGARLHPANLQAACRPCNDHKARTNDRHPPSH